MRVQGIVSKGTGKMRLRPATTFLALCTLICVTFPPAALSGNVSPRLYLEIYMYDTDPDSYLPRPAGLCSHSSQVAVIPCYSAKGPNYYGVVPIHISALDSPLARGWPPPSGPGGGYITVSCGIATSGVTLTFLGFSPCYGFLEGAGTPPQSIVVSATSSCHGVLDHPGYCKYLSNTNVGATYFNIVNNADDGAIKIVNCQASLDYGVGVGGGAQWGGAKTITCYSIPLEAGTWGKIKALYR